MAFFSGLCNKGKYLVFKKTHYGIEQICEEYAEKYRAENAEKLFYISAEIAVIQKEENANYRKQYYKKCINCYSGIFFVPVYFFQVLSPSR